MYCTLFHREFGENRNPTPPVLCWLNTNNMARDRTSWFPIELFHHRYDVVRDSSATGVGAEETNSVVCLLYRPYTKAYDSDDPALLWTVSTLFGVPQSMISVIRQFQEDMRACVQLGDGVCSGWFAVEQDLRRTPPVQQLFRGEYKRGLHAFQEGRRHHGRFRDGGEQPLESQPRRRRFGACFTLTMAESSRNRPSI